MYTLMTSLSNAISSYFAVSASNSTVSVPYINTYILPATHVGDVANDFVRSSTFDASIDKLLKSASKSPFVSYSSEFSKLLGSNPVLKLVSEDLSFPFAYEAGVWVPEKNEVWFTSSIWAGYSYLSILDLNSSKVYQPSLSQPVTNPNGGYYFNGKVYLTAIGNETYAGGIYSIDPYTYQTDIVVNSYFGLRFNAVDDVTWAALPAHSKSKWIGSTRTQKKGVMFFTDPHFRSFVANYTLPMALPNAVWRFDPSVPVLTPVIPRSDILTPNGIRVNKESTLLYVTDTTPTIEGGPFAKGAGAENHGSPAIFKYDLDSEGFPVNKRLIGLVRRAVGDGLHIDDRGRIWTGEFEGIVVRDGNNGKVLGMFNAEQLVPGNEEGDSALKLANFALAGDTLVILAVGRLWTVKLNEVLVSPERYKL